MTNVIASIIIIALLAGAVTYIVRAKRKGVKCIGCPAAGNCSRNKPQSSACGCGCHSDEEKKKYTKLLM